MRQKKYFIFTSTLLLLIPLVLLAFSNISDRKIASLIAGTMFLFLPLAHLWSSYKKTKTFLPLVWWIAYGQFLILFAGPIYFLQIAYFESEFSALSFLGVPSSVLHQYSSYSYSLMIIANVFYFFKDKKA